MHTRTQPQALSLFSQYFTTKNTLRKRDVVSYSEVYEMSWGVEGSNPGVLIVCVCMYMYIDECMHVHVDICMYMHVHAYLRITNALVNVCPCEFEPNEVLWDSLHDPSHVYSIVIHIYIHVDSPYLSQYSQRCICLYAWQAWR